MRLTISFILEDLETECQDVRRVASSIDNTCNIMYRCSFVFRELSLSLFSNIGVGIITQKYLSFQRILKRSAFASHSFCIENIVGLIILDLPIKLPKAGKVYLSIFFNACVST